MLSRAFLFLFFSSSSPGHGRTTSHQPEVILNNFNTRLGHRVGRMLGSLLHQVPNFKGRRVVTFHNQRDFIFFRHHRYIFESKEKARLQELGPKFTLKLRWMQHGIFDTQHGEMEWLHKVSRRTKQTEATETTAADEGQRRSGVVAEPTAAEGLRAQAISACVRVALDSSRLSFVICASLPLRVLVVFTRVQKEMDTSRRRFFL